MQKNRYAHFGKPGHQSVPETQHNRSGKDISEKTQRHGYRRGKLTDHIDREKDRKWLKEILDTDCKAIASGETDIIDSCTLMCRYGAKLNAVIGNDENIKITTPEDFIMFRALYDAKENQQIDW